MTNIPGADELLELYGDRNITIGLPARWLWREFQYEKNTRFAVLQQLRQWYEEEHMVDAEKINKEGLAPGKGAFGYVLGEKEVQHEGLIEAENMKEALKRMTEVLDFTDVMDVQVTSKPEEW